MNDAHSSRHDAAGGPDRDRRPQDPYADPYAADYPDYPDQAGPDGYATGQYQQGYQQDPYGQDTYAQDPYAGQQQDYGYGYDPYAAQQPQQQTQQQQTYGYDPYPAEGYGTGVQPQAPQQQGYDDQYGTDTGQYGTGTDTGQYPAYPQDPYAQPQQDPQAQQRVAPPSRDPNPYDELASLADPDPDPGGSDEPARTAADYRTEQFSFVDDEEEDEEVIDWLKFAETRTERRGERKRRGRNRGIALIVVLVLAAVGGVGYLWQQDKLPFGGDDKEPAAATAQKRDVIVVHLRELDSKNSSTALLVDNETTGKGTTVLLPNSLAVSTDDAGSSTLGKSVVEAGAGPTRDSLSTLLGAQIKGTWRLDTPFLELLVESVGGIQIDTDAQVRGTGKNKDRTLVEKGENQVLKGAAAVAYATFHGPGESADKQLARFGQVMQAVLKKMPSTASGATQTVESLGSVADPSLSDKELGASLAPLAEQAKTGKYQTMTLAVQKDGTLGESTTKDVVRNVLGGTVKNTDPSATPTVSVQNASGRSDAAGKAQIALVNSGYTFVAGGTAKAPVAQSRVEYTAEISAQVAQEVAQTLGLSKSAVKKTSSGAGNAEIRVVLGQDYKQ